MAHDAQLGATAGHQLAGHFIAPVLGLIGLLFILGGLALYGLAYYL